MTELEPIPRSWWRLWPVRAFGDMVLDGVVFHPVPGSPGVYEPHEMGFWLTLIQIETFRLGPRALVELERERHYGKE